MNPITSKQSKLSTQLSAGIRGYSQANIPKRNSITAATGALLDWKYLSVNQPAQKAPNEPARGKAIAL